MDAMFKFSGNNVSKLPHDHHELIAMVAPRALLMLGNPSQVWLAEESGYISCVAARKVWENFGIADRMGYSFNADHDHCDLPAIQVSEVEAFVDKFLFSDTTVNTKVTIHEYNDVFPEYWFEWWGTGKPEFATLDRGNSEEVWFEAECGTVGAAWNVRLDTLASNESYAVPKDGLESRTEAPADDEAVISFPFTVNTNSTYYLYGLVNCLSGKDAFWIKMDDGSFSVAGGLFTNGWEWKEINSFNLSTGEHTLTIAYFADEAKLDKICISEFHYPPGKLGEPADFMCEPDTTTKFYTALDVTNTNDAYTLAQNYPNPFNTNTTITFEIPLGTNVSLKVYSILGEEIAELAGKEYDAGKHTIDFDAQNLSKGIYFYTLKTDEFSASRKMIIQTE
jgi:hypothetical protein